MRVLSYNILAPSYARPERYPFTDPLLLAWEARRDRLARRIIDTGADVVCLQEVEPYVFLYLQSRLELAGYAGLFAQKAGNRPDGCATLYLTGRLALVGSRPVHFHDGIDEADSGHLVLVTEFDVEGRMVSVANTHIRWDQPEARGERHIGYRQVKELLQTCRTCSKDGCVVCGDFNAEPATELIRQMTSSGFVDAYGLAPQPTANSECRAKRIDYIFHSEQIASEPAPLPEIGDETPLPSNTEPSDHLAIGAELRIAGRQL